MGKIFKLGRLLSQEEQDEVAAVISRHLDAFAWSASDMPGIDPDFLCHHLTMDPKVRPVRQRRRKFNEERRLVVQEETKKLLSAGHIREIQYPEWLANVVLVKKANGKWRMCVDFADLNKACPKDSVPSRIRALTKSRSKSTSGLKVNIRRRLGEETPSASVATRKRRQGRASPR